MAIRENYNQDQTVITYEQTGRSTNTNELAMNQTDKVSANKLSVRLELLADFYAGVWAHHDNAMFQSIEPGDLQEAIDCAKKIGDNYLQEKARGYSQPESFTHGTSAQRMKWLKLGFDTGDIRRGNTFEQSDAEL